MSAASRMRGRDSAVAEICPCIVLSSTDYAFAVVNYLKQDFAMSLLRVRVWLPKVTGWLGVGRGLLPERERKRDQKALGDSLGD